MVGIETDRGPWVQALIAAGYQVYAINPLQVARYRERHGVSGAKSDTGDAHALADMVRTDGHQLRPVAGDSAQAEAVKVVTRAHKTLIWERTRHLLRLRHALREFFPAALVAFEDLTATDTLELLGAAPDPATAAALTHRADHRRARACPPPRPGRESRGNRRRATCRAPGPARGRDRRLRGHRPRPGRDPRPSSTPRSRPWRSRSRPILASTRTLRSTSASPASASCSAPGCSPSSATTRHRYADARARKNYAGTSPITRQSGKKKTVLARYVHNDRLVDALGLQAFAALRASPGARAYYDQLRARGTSHRAALRQLGNRLVGILHGCLKTATNYDEEQAWTPANQELQNAA